MSAFDLKRKLIVGFRMSPLCHVWTAPSWQELSSRFAALVGAAMCSAFKVRSTATILMALTCRWGSRPQHQKQTFAHETEIPLRGGLPEVRSGVLIRRLYSSGSSAFCASLERLLCLQTPNVLGQCKNFGTREQHGIVMRIRVVALEFVHLAPDRHIL